MQSVSAATELEDGEDSSQHQSNMHRTGNSRKASSNLLGIVGAILGVYFKVVALRGNKKYARV